MKLAQSLALIITGSASFVIPFALAGGFHIGKVTQPDVTSYATACDSDNFACSCFKQSTYNNPGASVSQNAEGIISIAKGLCGAGKLNLYYNQSDGSWIIYYDRGNGTSQGTCYPTSATLPCDHNSVVNDFLICYSPNICNP